MNRFECPFATKYCMLSRVAEYLGIIPPSIQGKKRKNPKEVASKGSGPGVENRPAGELTTINGG
jgi:hypothetical protein